MISKHLVFRLFLSAILSGLIFVTLTQGVAFARSHLLPQSYTCSESACDGHYPEASPWNCASDPNLYAVSGAKFEFLGYGGDAWVTLMYSPRCGTNWTRMTMISGPGPVNSLDIRRKNTDGSCYSATIGSSGYILNSTTIDSVMLFSPTCTASAGVEYMNGSATVKVYTPYF